MADTCRVCLCRDRRMHAINNTVFVEVWEKLTNAKFNTNDGKPLLVCYICGAQLRKSHQLMERARKAEELLAAVINNRSKQSRKPILLVASLTHDFDYNYAIGEMCQLECKQFERNTVEEIKKENEQGNEEEFVINIKEEEEGNTEEDIEKVNSVVSEEGNEEENDINIKEEEEDNCEEDVEKENAGVSEEGNEEEFVINIKEEKEGNTEEDIEKVNSVVSEEGNEEENDINIKEEEEGNFEEDVEKGNAGASEEGNEEENDINIKNEQGDCSNLNQEEYVDVADVESGPPSDDDMLPKKILERKVLIILKKIDIGAPATKRKSIEVPQKAKRIKLDEINESKKCLTNAAVYNLPKFLYVDSNQEIPKREQIINSTVNCYQVNKISPKHKILAKNTIQQNDKTLTSNICYNNAENEIFKQCLLKSTDAVDASTFLDGTDEGNKLYIRNKNRLINRFSCHICQFKCVTKTDLNRHLFIHNGEKPYICEYCDYRSSRKSHLKSHITFKHTKERKFSCHICRFKCVTKTDLNRHLFVHTGEKPYKCDLCDYKCSEKGNLKSHIKFKHTKEKNFSCHICQFKCVTKTNLNKHLRKHTG